jgi:hypothetical protein
MVPFACQPGAPSASVSSRRPDPDGQTIFDQDPTQIAAIQPGAAGGPGSGWCQGVRDQRLAGKCVGSDPSFPSSDRRRAATSTVLPMPCSSPSPPIRSKGATQPAPRNTCTTALRSLSRCPAIEVLRSGSWSITAGSRLRMLQGRRAAAGQRLDVVGRSRSAGTASPLTHRRQPVEQRPDETGYSDPSIREVGRSQHLTLTRRLRILLTRDPLPRDRAPGAAPTAPGGSRQSRRGTASLLLGRLEGSRARQACARREGPPLLCALREETSVFSATSSRGSNLQTTGDERPASKQWSLLCSAWPMVLFPTPDSGLRIRRTPASLGVAVSTAKRASRRIGSETPTMHPGRCASVPRGP